MISLKQNKINRWLCLQGCLIALVMAGCATPPIVHPDIPTVWYPSPHFDQRRPQFIVIHHDANDSAEQGLHTLTNPAGRVSAHYLIAKNGTIYQLVDEQKRAWHAGRSHWGADTDLNSSSIGIELNNNGHEPFPNAQIDALLQLLEDIQHRYHIPSANIMGHSDIAPRRKVDPSHYFPWELLAKKGFGRWCTQDPLPMLPPMFDIEMALRALGYDITSLEGAIGAFKLHYFPDNQEKILSEQEQQVLYCLVKNAH
jgi:N-acetylmuramoyl-L-alanine amidase